MPLFSINKNKLERVRKIGFKLERDLQNLTEENLEEIFGLEMVKSEFQLNNLRIDSLAFDKESNSFVIIEYKRGVNFSVIDQGYAYLALLLNNKADFILEYNEQMDGNLRRDDVDWSQSRVIFVAPQFTTYQFKSIEFKDLAFELWEVNRFSNDTILFNQIKAQDTNESITKVSKTNKTVQKVSKEVKVMTEDHHLKNSNEPIVELYLKVKGKILEMDSNIEIKPFINVISFKIEKQFVNVALQQSQLKIWLNMKLGELDDPRSMARDVSNVGHWGVGDYEISLKPEDDLNYLMTLIEQSYLKNS
jgi:predicted transport protein